MQLETRQINEHIAYLDNGLLNTPGIGATYLVRGDELALVETGTSLSAPLVLDGLRRLGIAPADVRHIVLTHVHMDHAGGTGTLLPAMPEAQVYIHSRTARFLIDPSELLVSAERALGPLFPLHGVVEPVPAERIVAADNLRLDLGRGVALQAIYTPGHSPDHLSYYEQSSRVLITGDSLGVMIPAGNYAGPVSPPPSVNVDAQRETFAKLLALDCDMLLFSHYGPTSQVPRPTIEMLRDRYEQFVALVEACWAAGHIDHHGIVRTMLDRAPLEGRTAEMMAGWIEMSINGLVLYFEKQAKRAQES